MKKCIRKAISFMLFLCVMISCVCLCSCDKGNLWSTGNDKDKYAEDRFTAYIGADYKTDFMEQKFTVDDFKSEYIERIDYDHEVWYSDSDMGIVFIKLKDEYKDRLDEVMQHVNDLPFVTSVEKDGFIHLA